MQHVITSRYSTHVIVYISSLAYEGLLPEKNKNENKKTKQNHANPKVTPKVTMISDFGLENEQNISNRRLIFQWQYRFKQPYIFSKEDINCPDINCPASARIISSFDF